MIKITGYDHFLEEVGSETIPVLVSCIRKGGDYRSQLQMLENTSKTFGNTCKVCLVSEDFLEVFCVSHAVTGTPTFIVFTNGLERARKLGQVNQEAMDSFICQTLAALSAVDSELR